MIIIGIDPGTKGGITVLSQDKRVISNLRFSKCTTADVANHLKATITAYDEHPAHAYLERVSAMPHQGVVSTFKFGESFGIIQGILTALNVPCELVTPRSWQKHFGVQSAKSLGLSKTKHKQKLKGLAQQKFPNETIVLENCDAYLIALYGLDQELTYNYA